MKDKTALLQETRRYFILIPIVLNLDATPETAPQGILLIKSSNKKIGSYQLIYLIKISNF